MTRDHHHYHLITEWEYCPVCGTRNIPASNGTTVEMQCYVEFLSRMYLVRAHVDLGHRQYLCVHPFELTAITKFGESPSFRWRVAGRSVTILPYAPILNLHEAEQFLKTWALQRIEVSMEHQSSANLPKPRQL